MCVAAAHGERYDADGDKRGVRACSGAGDDNGDGVGDAIVIEIGVRAGWVRDVGERATFMLGLVVEWRRAPGVEVS